jgi:hypothetical protein
MVVVIASLVGGGQPICDDFGWLWLPVKTVPALVVEGDGDMIRRYLHEGITVTAIVYSFVLLRGKH